MARRSGKSGGEKVSHIEFVSAGLLSDVDVEFTNCRFMRWTYPNSKTEITVFAIDAVPEGEEEATELTWSIGGDDDFMPSEDGMSLVQNGDRSSLAKNSKYQALVNSFRDEGMPDSAMEEFGDSADYLDGVKAHIERRPYKGFRGSSSSARRRGAEEEERENEVVLVTSFLAAPWDKGSKKSTKASAKSGSKASKKKEDDDAGDDAGGDDNEELARKAILKVLKEADDNTMDFDDMVLEAYQEGLPDDLDKKTKKQIMNELINDRKWVAKLKGVEIEGDSVSLG